MALKSREMLAYGRRISIGKCFAIGAAGVLLSLYLDGKLTPFPSLSQQEVDQLKQKDNPAVYNFASWDDLYEQLIDGRCPDEILPHVNAILDGTLESQGPAELLAAVSGAALLLIFNLRTSSPLSHIIYNSMLMGSASYRIWKQYYRIKPVVRTRLTQSKVSPAFPLMYERCPSHNLPPAPVTKIIQVVHVPGRTVAFY